ncbi:hypothetical protein JCM16303_004057 [Sporobolomyces ruberrimus]
MSRYAPVRPQPKEPRVDREKTCPSLLRVFVNSQHHHPDSAFTNSSLPVSNEYQVFVWRDSTLREIVLSLRDAAPHLRNNTFAKYSLKLVFWDSKLDRHTSTDLASIAAKELGAMSSSEPRRAAGAADKSLTQVKYVVGDFIDVAYILPGAPPNPSASSNVSAIGPQFAPSPAFPGPRGAISGAQQVTRGLVAPQRMGPRGDTWAPTRPGSNGFGPRGGAGAGGGGPRFGATAGRPAPADQGWGNRQARDRAPHGKNVCLRFLSAIQTIAAQLTSFCTSRLHVIPGRFVATRGPSLPAKCGNLDLVLDPAPVRVLPPAPAHPGPIAQETIGMEPTLR